MLRSCNQKGFEKEAKVSYKDADPSHTGVWSYSHPDETSKKCQVPSNKSTFGMLQRNSPFFKFRLWVVFFNREVAADFPLAAAVSAACGLGAEFVGG